MTYDHIRVRPLATSVGAEISGIDLVRSPGGPELAEIRRALGEYGVVFFRDQQLSPEQHIAFAHCFGEIDVNRFFATAPGYPMIAEVRKEPEQQRNIGNGWHTDHSYDEAPALGSMLYARDVPKTGGDTLFASMYAAYDDAVGRSEIDHRRAEGTAFEPPCFRRRSSGEAGRPRGPHSQRRARDPGRRAPGRHPPPPHRPQGSVRQPGFHRAL
jgi:alpha-ketoglutarate-dependent taurine dioxygenase